MSDRSRDVAGIIRRVTELSELLAIALEAFGEDASEVDASEVDDPERAIAWGKLVEAVLLEREAVMRVGERMDELGLLTPELHAALEGEPEEEDEP